MDIFSLGCKLLLRTMRSIARGAPAALAIAALILCVGSLIMSLRAKRHFDRAWYASAVSADGKSRLLCIVSWSGRCIGEWDDDRFEGADVRSARPKSLWRVVSEPTATGENWDWKFRSSPSDIQCLGCKFYRCITYNLVGADIVESRQVVGIAVPWVVLAVALWPVFPIWAWGRLRRRWRRLRQTCVRCGYDLLRHPRSLPRMRRAILRTNPSKA